MNFKTAFLVVGLLSMATPVAGQKNHEQNIGQFMDRLVRDDYQVLEVPSVQESVNALGRKIVQVSGNPNGFQFVFTVLNDSVPRAFSGPGGFVYLTTGLLELATSRDEVAAVLAHEVAHVNERHQSKFARTPKSAIAVLLATEIGGQLAAGYAAQSYAKGNASGKASLYDSWMAEMNANQLSNLVLTVVNGMGMLAMNAIYKNYTAGDELKADDLAFDYSRVAGFDGAQLKIILEKVTGFSAQGVDRLPGWHRDLASDQYPKLEERLRRLESKVARKPSTTSNKHAPSTNEGNGLNDRRQEVPTVKGPEFDKSVKYPAAQPNQLSSGDFALNSARNGESFGPDAATAKSGVIIWEGDTDGGEVLTLQPMQASSVGRVSGGLPGRPVTIEIEPSDVKIIASPVEQNGWGLLVVHTGRERRSRIVVKWTLK